MRLGFFMGSFDPIHIGHLNIINEALNSKLLDKIIVVPSGHNPWKKNEPAPFAIRVKMIEEAIAPFGDKCEVTMIEGTFEPPFYSNKPLNHFKKQYPNDTLVILCGTDTAVKIPYWKNALTDILPYYEILAVSREETNEESTMGVGAIIGPDAVRYTYKVINSAPIEISSTAIRNLVKEGKSIYPLVPPSVIKVIAECELYK